MLQDTNKFFLASAGAPPLRNLLGQGLPTCTPGSPIQVVEGDTATFTPNCTDADGSTTQEFEITVEPTLGNASVSGDYGAINYTPNASTAGQEDQISYRVTTQNGLSSGYTQSLAIIPPDEDPPVVQITAPTVESTLYSSPATLHYTVSDNRDSSPSCNLADEAQIPLDAGDNTITVSCEDDAGNIGQDSVSFTYVPPDTTDPVVDITGPIDGSIQAEPTATLSYTASDDRDLVLDCSLIDGSELSLTEGPNTFTVTCEDDAGNVGSDSVTVDLDSTPPDITITTPVGGAVVDTAAVTLEYSVSDNIDSEPSCDVSSGSEVSLSVGPNLITVTCEDAVGNSAQVSVAVTYDADPPTVQITAPTDGAIVTSSPITLHFTATDDATSELSCDASDGDVVPLTVGENTITVTCTDDAGHTGSDSATLTYDAAAPEVSIDSPADGATLTTNPAVLHYTVTDDVDPEPECSAADGSDVQLVGGSNTITVTCTDAAGQIGTDSSRVTYTPPTEVRALATPEIRKSANLEPTSGEVLIKLPGSDTYIPLSEAVLIPVGTMIDARGGKAHLTLANADGTTYDAFFWDGIFQVFQGTGDQPIATMKLRDDLIDDKRHGSRAHSRRAGADPFKTVRTARARQEEERPVGRRQGQVPHQRQRRIGDRARNQVVRRQLRRRHALQGQPRICDVRPVHGRLLRPEGRRVPVRRVQAADQEPAREEEQEETAGEEGLFMSLP